MDIIALEQELTAYLADALGLEIDTKLFRGGFPEGTGDGVAVILGNAVKDNSIDTPMYQLQILGKFTDRDTALRVNYMAVHLFPVYGKSIGGHRVNLTIYGAGNIYRGADDGTIKHFLSVNLMVSVLG